MARRATKTVELEGVGEAELAALRADKMALDELHGRVKLLTASVMEREASVIARLKAGGSVHGALKARVQTVVASVGRVVPAWKAWFMTMAKTAGKDPEAEVLKVQALTPKSPDRVEDRLVIEEA